MYVRIVTITGAMDIDGGIRWFSETSFREIVLTGF
jgi:hypothetical protein